MEGNDPGWSSTLVDRPMDADAVAQFAAALAPGPDSVECLALVGPEELSDAGGIDTLIGLRRAQAWLQAREHRQLAAMVDAVEARESLHDPSGHCFLAEEIACALHVAPSTAEDRLLTSVDLARRLPATLDLLESGAISPAHARVLRSLLRFETRGTRPRCSDQCRRRRAGGRQSRSGAVMTTQQHECRRDARRRLET